MRKLTTIITALTLIFTGSVYAADNISIDLADAVDRFDSPDSLVEVVVMLDDSQLQESASKLRNDLNIRREERIKAVVNSSISFKNAQQKEIESFLNERSYTTVEKHWIVPSYTAKLKLSDIKELSEISGIKLIVENVTVNFDPPVKTDNNIPMVSSEVSTELSHLNVPQVWQRGITGKGRLVCSFDTGVDYDHPALLSKWRGLNNPLSEVWFSKVAPDSLPYDAKGHGTHTMGLMVGSLAADSFGVAPDAEWISAGIIDQGRSLNLTIADIIEAFQWSLNPDNDLTTFDDVPDVILNSWGIPKGLFAPCEDRFWGIIDIVEAAGIVTIFAAGNEGPAPMSLRSPADRASSPLNSFAVGAVDSDDLIASFSSRGPSSCDQDQIKPEVVAPGVSIRSCQNGGGFTTMSGTSMAAPFVAGAVALIRQYNPNATVDQIKTALLMSARDLGTPGEDNDYGHGIIDIEKAFDYIPSPELPDIEVIASNFSEDKIAVPGETVEMFLTLKNNQANIDLLYGEIVENESLLMLSNEIRPFSFELNGEFAFNFEPFNFTLNDSLYHGQLLNLKLAVTTPDSSFADTIDFIIEVGYPSPGSEALLANGKISFTISDFGQFGLAPGSIYNLNHVGVTYNGSENLLYEAGIITGRNSLQLSKSVRDENGQFAVSEFSSSGQFYSPVYSENGSVAYNTDYTDSNSDLPIPVAVKQNVSVSENLDEKDFVIFEFDIKNNGVEDLTGLSFGFLADFDAGSVDRFDHDSQSSMLIQITDSNFYIGILPLENIGGFTTLSNSTSKTGFTDEQLYDMISSDVNNIDSEIEGDLMFILSTGSFDLSQSDSRKAAFALVFANDLNELYLSAQRAKNKYDLSTDISDNNSLLPSEFALYQNYPNPFNPTTTIEFSLPKADEIELEVFNITGQKVKTIYAGFKEAGRHSFEWDATDDGGEKVASAMYFYRLKKRGYYAQQKNAPAKII